MAVNKVIAENKILIDLSEDDVTPYDVRSGVTFHTKNGEPSVGVYEMEEPKIVDNPSIINKNLVNKIVSLNEVLLDLSQDTITPYDVRYGKKFHMRNGELTLGVYVPECDPYMEMSARYNWADYLKYIRGSFDSSLTTNCFEMMQMGEAQDQYGETASSSRHVEYNITNNSELGIFKKDSILTLSASITIEDEIPEGCYHLTNVYIHERNKDSNSNLTTHNIFSDEDRMKNIVSNKELIFTLKNDCDYLVIDVIFYRIIREGYTEVKKMFEDITIKLENIMIDNHIVQKGEMVVYHLDFYNRLLNDIYQKHNVTSEEYPYYVIGSSNGQGARYVFVSKTQKHPYKVEYSGSSKMSYIRIDDDMIAYQYSFSSNFIEDITYKTPTLYGTVLDIDERYYERNNYEVVYEDKYILQENWLRVPVNPIE